jgi:hypothetical protein
MVRNGRMLSKVTIAKMSHGKYGSHGNKYNNSGVKVTMVTML